MPIDSAWNAYIFRDGKSTVSGPRLRNELASGLSALNTSPSRAVDVMHALLRAGELECALSDLESPDTVLLQNVTDTLAASFVSGTPADGGLLARTVRAAAVPDQVNVAPPEGFAYYALHPLDYVDLVSELPRPHCAAIVGIRSIGTTLSAVLQAALGAAEVAAQRITVRPTGHPYDRQTDFSPPQQAWVQKMLAANARFFVIDEGPGMSGSSFLSVGDALLLARVPRSQITFLCSHQPNPASLTGPNAAERWVSFDARYVKPTRHLPLQAKKYVAGGIWRARVFGDESEWPPSWRQMERLKFLSEDEHLLFRFEGFGRFGAEVCRRAMIVGAAGFGPIPLQSEEGFGVYGMIPGRHLSPADVNADLLTRLADYCAFRAREVTANVQRTPELETMLRFNTLEEFGVEIPDSFSRLHIERPVIADGRMLPYKWIAPVSGPTLKVDNASHGDDHFFPGPTDIAWDLAGAIVEWNLSAQASDFFVTAYRDFSGDNPRERLPVYLLAYSVFRMAYCKMAAAASTGTPEQDRFLREYSRYRQCSEFALAQGSTAIGETLSRKTGIQAA